MTIVSNSFKMKKMVLKDVWDLILSEEISWRELEETSNSSLTLNPEVDSMLETQIGVNQNQDETSLDMGRKKLVVGMKRDCKALKKNNGSAKEFANLVKNTGKML